MAHQAHNIPWSNVSSNLSWRARCPCRDDATDLHLRRKPDQGKKLDYFVNAFVRNIKTHVDIERAKYPAEYAAPEPEDVVISDAVARKITPSVAQDYHRYWRRGDRRTGKGPAAPTCTQWGGLCRGEHGDVFCCCAFPYTERKMKAFLREGQRRTSIGLRYGNYEFREWEWDSSHRGFFNPQLIHILILYGEMDTLLRIRAHPGNDLGYWRQHYDSLDWEAHGWHRIVDFALDWYILLNVIYCHTETWDTCQAGYDSAKDYRNSRVYQELVWRSTGYSQWEMDAATYPHRQFFGIPKELTCYYYRSYSRKYDDRYLLHHPAGKFPYLDYLKRFQNCAHQYGKVVPLDYVPLHSDVPHVRWILCEKGLPVEIAQSILEEAGYSGRRRLPVPHDPFHKENRAELMNHLTYCWKLMIRCELLARETTAKNASWDDWDKRVSESLIRLFACGCSGKMYKPIDYSLDDWRYEFA